MPFESISQRHTFQFDDFPERWLPLIYLYDPDLPLFPVYYFHVLDPKDYSGRRPRNDERAYGFISHVRFAGSTLEVEVATNKNLSDSQNQSLRNRVQEEVSNLLGVADSISVQEMSSAFHADLENANSLLTELWHKVIDPAFGGTLPFGRMWDGVYGVARWVASWNSDGGRKGELIQLHDFCRSFGEKIATGNGIHADFYLLPSWDEFRSTENPLNEFKRFRKLMKAAGWFVESYCHRIQVGNNAYSSFDRSSFPGTRNLSNPDIREFFENTCPSEHREALSNNWSVFNRGPQRSVFALMMFDDLRNLRWSPTQIDWEEAGKLYRELGGSYQSAKVIELYAQLSFGNKSVLPIDVWIRTFLRYPLGFKRWKNQKEVLSQSEIWGRIERLIWSSVQGRKVHTSYCGDILWCIRYGDTDKEIRGANPFSCKICSEVIRDVCPSYAAIKDKPVHFNPSRQIPDDSFLVTTSAGNNSSSGQRFVYCSGDGISDMYSVNDKPEEFSDYPQSGHDGRPISVSTFISKY
ncbi:MAG: hypothetical protein R3348_05955 [Xanthomonadales bacterium]|nr:hypothetical protein [Xanthomonadales bacterium]